jgi:serine protease
VSKHRLVRMRLLAATLACAVALPVAARPGPDGVDRFVVRFKPGTAQRADGLARQRALDDASREHGLHLGQQRRMALGAELVVTDRKLDPAQARAFIASLRRDPSVESVEVDRRMRAVFTPNDAYYNQQWHYSESTGGIRAPAAWDIATGTGVVVAVLDTGVTTHPDLDFAIVAGYDFISDEEIANDGSARDPYPTDPGDWTTANECEDELPGENSSWHGTHVAGTIAAVTHNGVGVAGIAFHAKVQPLRVLGKCGGWTSDIADAIVWAAGGSVPGVPANTTPAEVINLSLGGPGACDSYTQNAIDYAVAQGSVVVVAAGNDDDDAAGYSPATCNNVITVGASTRAGGRASYTNYGPPVDVSAPGGDDGDLVVSTWNAGTTVAGAPAYAGMGGTSMATPHVAGVAALMQSRAVRTPAMVETILKGTTRPMVVGCGAKPCGTGLVDAPAALEALDGPFLYLEDAPVVLEGNAGTKTVVFTARLSAAVAGPVTFDVATANGTASAGSDYVATTLSDLAIPAGQTSKTFTVTVNGDATAEPDETFTATISGVTGVDAIGRTASAVIVNDEATVLTNGVPLTGLAASAGTQTLYKITVPTGATNLSFITSGGNGGDADLYVRADMSPTQGSTCSSFSPESGENCTLPNPGAGATWYVLVHAFSSYSALTLTASYTAPATPTGTLSVSNAAITEGNAGTKVMAFTVHLSEPAAVPATFNFATANGTATAGSDYVALSLANQSIPAGQVAKTFNVTINGDVAIENDEAFTVNLSNANATIADAQGTGTITNDDKPKLSIADVSISEGYSGTKSAVFTVALTQAAPFPVSFNIATTGAGTATAGTDYVAKSLNGLQVAAGQTAKTVAVTLNGDATIEHNETFVVAVTNVNGAIVTDGSALGTITNDDLATLSLFSCSVVEGNSGTKAATWSVQASQASPFPVTFTAATTGMGTATSGVDYVALNQPGITLPAGQTHKSFTVTVNGDTTIEPNENFWVALSNPTNARISSDNADLCTIVNDDKPVLSIADVAMTEGNSGTKNAVFTVSIDQVAPYPVTFDIATTGAGTATAGVDYVAKSLSGLQIPAGQTAKTVAVTLNGDTTVEANETYVLSVTASPNATIGDGAALGTITNDD